MDFFSKLLIGHINTTSRNMWNQLLEDDISLRSIYGNSIPSLEGVFLHEIKISNGEELTCYVRFDLASLPHAAPAKWKERGVDAVQLTMQLISAGIIHFSSAGDDVVGDIEIKPAEGFKTVSYKAKGKEIFQMRAKWILINSISGYTKQGFMT